MRAFMGLLLLTAVAWPAVAQDKSYEIHAPGRSFEIQKPRGSWQVPGEIRQPTGKWQKPGEIQAPKGIQAVKAVAVNRCERRLSVVADALFDFDQAKLRARRRGNSAGGHARTQEARQQTLARRRPHRLQGRRRLQHEALGGARDHGARLDGAVANSFPRPPPSRASARSKPVASNTTDDGKDDPAGRQKKPSRGGRVRHLRLIDSRSSPASAAQPAWNSDIRTPGSLPSRVALATRRALRR